jgi:hypothetical protein
MAEVQTAHVRVKDLINYASEQMTMEFERRVTNHLESCDDCFIILDQIDEMSDESLLLMDELIGLGAYDDEDTRLS